MSEPHDGAPPLPQPPAGPLADAPAQPPTQAAADVPQRAVPPSPGAAADGSSVAVAPGTAAPGAAAPGIAAAAGVGPAGAGAELGLIRAEGAANPPDSAPVPAPSPSQAAPARPTFVFFGIVAACSLLADVTTKAWAEITLSRRDPMEPSIELIKDHLSFTLAYNKGGAWGLFQEHPEYVRRPFFLLVSLLAIAFIINLYGRLTTGQRALKWGLPLVLGGALGNLADRIVRSNVIDFIDYQADWIESMNRLIAKLQKGWIVTNHWPTFNVADIAICIGVGLMAVDMFTSRRGPSASIPPRPAPTPNAALPSSTAPSGGTDLPRGEQPGPHKTEPLDAPDATPPLKPEA